MSLAEEAPLPPTSSTSITPLAVFRSIEEDPDAVTFSPDGTQLLSASGFELLLWDVTSARPLRGFEIPGMFRDFTACAFSPDGRTILAGSNDGRVATWNAETGKLIKVLRSEDWMYDCVFSKDEWVLSCTFSPDGRSALATALHDRSFKLWDVESGKTLRAFVGHESSVRDAAFSPDGSRIVSASGDKTVRIWDTATGKALLVIGKHRGDVNGCAFLPGADSVISTSDDMTIRIFDATDGNPIRTLRAGYQVTSFAISPDGKQLFTGGAYERVQTLWDVETGKPIRHSGVPSQALREWMSWLCDITGFPHPSNDYVHSAAFSPDGKWLVTGSLDQGIRIRDGATGALLFRVRSRSGHSGSVGAVSFSADGRRLLTGSDDGTLKIWDFQQLLDSKRNP